jgi:hypothetical protein
MNFKAQDKYGFTAGNFASDTPRAPKTVDFGLDTGNITWNRKPMSAGSARAGDSLGGQHPWKEQATNAQRTVGNI